MLHIDLIHFLGFGWFMYHCSSFLHYSDMTVQKLCKPLEFVESCACWLITLQPLCCGVQHLCQLPHSGTLIRAGWWPAHIISTALPSHAKPGKLEKHSTPDKQFYDCQGPFCPERRPLLHSSLHPSGRLHPHLPSNYTSLFIPWKSRPASSHDVVIKSPTLGASQNKN